jgi:hypothetical protein
MASASWQQEDRSINDYIYRTARVARREIEHAAVEDSLMFDTIFATEMRALRDVASERRETGQRLRVQYESI